MSVLTSERYVEPPRPTAEEIEARHEAEQSKIQVRRKMARLIRKQKSGGLLGRVLFESAKAIYQTDDQPNGEFTRAWVSKSYNSDPLIWLHTDKVTVAKNGVAQVVAGSRFDHFALFGDGSMTSAHYEEDELEAKQIVQLMHGAEQTLELVEEETLKADAARPA